jgi:sirohydrochlorin ferrochelatase
VPVVPAGAGSSDPAARADVATPARYLENVRATDITTAYAGGDVDPVAQAVRDAGGGVAVSAYLLSPGHFSGLLEACGARWVAAPLGAHPAVIDAILARYAASGQEPVRPRISG